MPEVSEVERILKKAETCVLDSYESDVLLSALKESRRRESELRAQIETMNKRIATDAVGYERDQYLIAALRKQLRDAALLTEPKNG